MMTAVNRFLLFVALSSWGFLCAATDWSTFRGNMQRTGYYPNPTGMPGDTALWKLSLGCEIVSSPVVKDGVLYVGARDSAVYAIDCEQGKILWRYKTNGWVDATPVVSGNTLIVGSRDSTTYIFDKNTGTILGRLASGIQLSSPAVMVDGSILSGVGLHKAGMSAYGTEFSAGRQPQQRWSIPLPQFTYSSPAVSGQAAVIGATDGKLYGIDTWRNDTIWSVQTRGLVYLSTPAIDNTTVYFAPGDEDRAVYAVNLLTGKSLWRTETPTPLAQAQTGVMAKKAAGRILASVDLVQLLRLSPEYRNATIRHLKNQGFDLPRVAESRVMDDGGLRKNSARTRAEFIPLDGMKTSSVAVGPDNVYVIQKDLGYVLSDDRWVQHKQQYCIRAFDKRSGELRWSSCEWRKSLQLGYCSSPVVTQNMVFFGWGEGRLYGLDARSGEKIWQDSLNGHIISSPAIADNKLFVATMNGLVYAYNLVQTLPALNFDNGTYCYPNPARNGVSNIQMYVNEPADMSMAIFSMADKPVLRLNKPLAAGEKYTYVWSLKSVANGIYFARIKVKYLNGTEEKKTVKIAVLH